MFLDRRRSEISDLLQRKRVMSTIPLLGVPNCTFIGSWSNSVEVSQLLVGTLFVHVFFLIKREFGACYIETAISESCRYLRY